MIAKPRVFFPLKTPRFDTQAAEAFGERVFLLSDDYPSPFYSDEIARTFSRILRVHGFVPRLDYVALTGPTIFVALLLGQVMVEHRFARMLLFDARSSSYVERVNQPDAELFRT